MCNLIEMTMGLVAESSIPGHLRWLPMGMDVNYLKKAAGKLTAKSSIDPETFYVLPNYPGEVRMPVEVYNGDGVLVTKGDVRRMFDFRLCLLKHPLFCHHILSQVKLWISEKPVKASNKLS